MKKVVLIAIAVLIALPTCLHAQEPTAVELAKSFAASIRGLRTFSAEYTLSVAPTGPGGEFTIDAPVYIAVEKPNKFRLESRGAMMKGVVVSDGTKLWVQMAGASQVTTYPAPKSLSLFGLIPAEARAVTGLFSAFTLASLTQIGKTIGTETVDGREAYAVRIEVPGQVLAKVLIGKDDSMLYGLDATVDTSAIMDKMRKDKQPSENAPPAEKASIKITLVAKNLKANRALPAGTFRFVVPKGVKVIDQKGFMAPRKPQPTPSTPARPKHKP